MTEWIYRAAFANAFALLGTLLMFAFAGLVMSYFVRIRRRDFGQEASDVMRLSIALHGLVYYVTVFILRGHGAFFGGPFTTAISLWSTALRVHIVASLAIAEYGRRRYGQK